MIRVNSEDIYIKVLVCEIKIESYVFINFRRESGKVLFVIVRIKGGIGVVFLFCFYKVLYYKRRFGKRIVLRRYSWGKVISIIYRVGKVREEMVYFVLDVVFLIELGVYMMGF